MAINKVVYGNQTLMDLTADTVTASDVASGVTFHNAAGEAAVGTASSSSIDAIETTSSAYDLLPSADKLDPDKIYFLNDTQSGTQDTPIDAITFANRAENGNCMRLSVTNGKLTYAYKGGSAIGANSYRNIAIPSTVSKIKFKLTTGTSYSTGTNPDWVVCIGVKANQYNTDWINPTDSNWLVKKEFDTRNSSYEDYLDLSNISTDCYLMIVAHGWTVTFDEITLEEPSAPTGETKIKYKDITYGTNGLWKDLIQTLSAGNTSITFSDAKILNTSTLDFYTDIFGVCPTNVVVSSGSVTLTFDAQQTDMDVKVRITNTGAVSPYTFKSYLEVGNTAGAYINTGLNIATTQEFEVKFQLTDTQADNVVYFGCWQSYRDTMIYYYAGGFGCGVGGTMTPRHNFNTNIHVYKAMQNAIYLDDVQDGGVNWANAPTNVPYYFFKDPDHSGAINIRIYYAKIWDNGTLIRDFIPAVRNDDGVIGMYDQVNDVFYTNDGTGSFVTD